MKVGIQWIIVVEVLSKIECAGRRKICPLEPFCTKQTTPAVRNVEIEVLRSRRDIAVRAGEVPNLRKAGFGSFEIVVQ